MKRITILFSFLLVSSNFFSQQLGTLSHDGVIRNFMFYTPSTWDGESSLPLLIVLHGLTQTGSGVMDITQFNSIAEKEHFIVAYPSGINNAWNAQMNGSVSSANDLGFLENLVDWFELTMHTNPLKKYLCGFSNGAFMSYMLACESTHCFAGIASVSGTMSDTVFSNCSQPNQLTSILHIHGTADAVVPYAGSATTGISVDALLSKWVVFLSCEQQVNISEIPNNNLLDFSTCQRFIYSCGEYSLEHIKISGGGHQWPGINTWNGGVGTINMDFYSPLVIWEFFKSKSCLQDVGIELIENRKKFLIPNPSVGELRSPYYQELQSVYIYSIDGTLIQFIQEFQQEIISNDLSKGSYFICLRNKTQQQFWEKIIVN